MKKMSGFLIALSMASCLVYAEVDNSDLQRINALIEHHDYADALAGHQRFFEESRSSSGMAGVRLSFALSSWARLAQDYPPALVALKNLADERKSILLQGKGSFMTFSEFNAINRYLNKAKDTLEVFVVLDQQYPEQAKSFAGVAQEVLVDTKQLDLLKKYMKDPIYEYENIRNMREFELSALRKKGEQSNGVERINQQYEAKVSKLIELTLSVGRKDEADEIKKRSEAYITGNLQRKYY